MVAIKYTEAQQQELKKNKYVKSCTNKNINFTLECKIESVKLWNKGLFTKEIFKQLGFPEYVINSDIPCISLNRWRKNIKKGNIENKKGRPKVDKIDFNNLTQEQYIEYLETKLALYEELDKHMKSGYP